ncbi:MAG TPA: hypothetical protein PLM07_12610 [Candidatus Rifleibacterium sp.]|nr:hypothetical protein [Candidatus Rifleibacterium sp.]HPT46731.1 hypothetical protein [Candidatus Rifleibacterium sp.]
MDYINIKNFRLPNEDFELNDWLDHIEFLCCISQDGSITESAVVDRFFDENNNCPHTAALALGNDSDFPELSENYFDSSDLIDDEIIVLDIYDSQLHDRITDKIRNLFTSLACRTGAYGDDYPFITNNRSLKLKDNLTPLQSLYIALLFSSLLKLATKTGINRLGHLFEELCEPAFRRLTPAGASNFFFGSGSCRNSSDVITGSFFDKVKKLCSLLHLQPHPNFTKENAGRHNNGDGGLDWVGLLEFGDSQFSQPVFFGQCACGQNWVDKQFDAHQSKWKNYIHLCNAYLTYHFIPRNFRKDSLEWYNPLEIIDVVLIDRFRLMKLLRQEADLNDKIEQLYRPLFKEIEQNREHSGLFT